MEVAHESPLWFIPYSLEYQSFFNLTVHHCDMMVTGFNRSYAFFVQLTIG